MQDLGLEYLIVGHNDGQKQDINLGHKTNQEFVQIPYARFNGILQSVAVKYGIRVILQEESYTSKACFGTRDPIPVYGGRDAGKAVFSGARKRRGMYVQADGRCMNADVNGAANIGRKYEERIFPEDMDTSYLYGTVKALTYTDILQESQKRTKTLHQQKYSR